MMSTSALAMALLVASVDNILFTTLRYNVHFLALSARLELIDRFKH